jgi:hypothetical protein
MPDDLLNDVILDIIAYCEKLYLERSVLEAAVSTSSDRDWRLHYEAALADKEIRAAVHAEFEPARELLQKLVKQGRADEGLRELLRKLPSSKFVN